MSIVRRRLPGEVAGASSCLSDWSAREVLDEKQTEVGAQKLQATLEHKILRLEVEQECHQREDVSWMMSWGR